MGKTVDMLQLRNETKQSLLNLYYSSLSTITPRNWCLPFLERFSSLFGLAPPLFWCISDPLLCCKQKDKQTYEHSRLWQQTRTGSRGDVSLESPARLFQSVEGKEEGIMSPLILGIVAISLLLTSPWWTSCTDTLQNPALESRLPVRLNYVNKSLLWLHCSTVKLVFLFLFCVVAANKETSKWKVNETVLSTRAIVRFPCGVLMSLQDPHYGPRLLQNAAALMMVWSRSKRFHFHSLQVLGESKMGPQRGHQHTFRGDRRVQIFLASDFSFCVCGHLNTETKNSRAFLRKNK